MQRHWKTHDLVDFFRSVRDGHLHCNSSQFTNQQLSDDPQIPIKKLDVNWPQHMDMDKPDTEPDYQIESGVPVPAINRNVEYKWMPVLQALEPTQSFFIPFASDEESARMTNIIRFRINKYCPGKMFITRKIKATKEAPQLGIRIWRVS